MIGGWFFLDDATKSPQLRKSIYDNLYTLPDYHVLQETYSDFIHSATLRFSHAIKDI